MGAVARLVVSNMPGKTKLEVTTGVFDPRTYKLNDPHWARRRKSSWLAWPGTIKYTRERTVPVNEESEKEDHDEKEETDTVDRARKGVKEIKINVQRRIGCKSSFGVPLVE